MSAPFGLLEWHIVGRYLRARRQEGFISFIALISFIGIMLGVATLIVVMAVMNGFRADLLDRILGVSGHALVRNAQIELENADALIEKLTAIEGVKSASPMLDGQAMISLHKGRVVRGVMIRGMPIDKFAYLPALAGRIEQGALADLADQKSIAIGVRLAENYGIGLGDKVTLITPQGTITPFGMVPLVKSYRVRAVFNIGLSDYDSGVVLLPLAATQQLFGRDEKAGVIEVMFDDPEKVDSIAPLIREAVGNEFRVTDWKRSNATLSGALEVERNVMFLILTLILLVASLNIVSGLVMLVRDKGRDIAVMRSMGAHRGMILRIFFLTGASIGVAGTLFGVLLGVIFCTYIEEIRQFLIWITGAEIFSAEIYFLDKMPARMELPEVMSVVIMALVLSFISTLYPAWRAARMQPVEALRYE